ncbi:hypothetical protein JXA47_01580 [Candidatus Sumerlaeota bacterium]|nr:hypothetical protein [Candidatus Sumerlaeota bacterium]
MTSQATSPSPTCPAEALSRRETSRELLFALALALWILAYVVLSFLTAAMHEDDLGLLGGTRLLMLPLLAAVILILTTLWLLMRGVMCRWSLTAAVLGAVGCVIVNQVLHALMSPEPGREVQTVSLFGFANVALIGASLFIGRLIGGRVERLSWVVPIVLVVALVDCWSVFFGPTGEIVEEIIEEPARAEVGQRLLLWYPNLTPTRPEGLAVKPSFGIGDLIIGALLLEIARRFGLRMGITLLALAIGSLAALVAPALIASLHGLPGFPALPLMGLAFIAFHWRGLEFNRREITLCVVFLVALFVLLITVVNPLLSRIMPGGAG